jgi:hypothetical protein
MKFKASNVNIPEVEIEIINIPKLTFEEVEVMHSDGVSTAWVAGNHTWNRLETIGDLSPLFGQAFNMTSDDWDIDTCYVCVDKKSILFRNATMKRPGTFKDFGVEKV